MGSTGNLRHLLLALSWLPAWALAGSVYLNGVNIDGVTNVKFDKASIRIDESGNIHIDAPGYAAKVVQGAPEAAPAPQPATPAPPRPAATVQTQPPSPQTAAPARITKRYWLVTTQTAPGMTEYDIDVYINAKWLMTLRNTADQEVVDITRHLLPGDNMVTFEARKLSAGPRKSFSREHAFTVVVGEGNEAQGNVMIDNPIVTFRRTAADNDNVSKDFPLRTR